MPKLEIIKSGLMTSIQDLGRKGLAYYAIPQSGVMDKNAAKVALLLLNKNEHSPLIECTFMAPHIQFHEATQIVITGADFNWQINDRPVSRNTILNISKKDILKGLNAKDGLRGYIAIKGELMIDKIYNSYATYTNAGIGGYQGRLLKKGDVIEWKENYNNDFTKVIIPIQKGPEFDFLTHQSKEQLTKNQYKISSDSNRMGARLLGNKLESASYQLKYSLPVLPGFIQLPPSGVPIVVLQDGQTTGGYPRIAYIPERYLNQFNQIPLGGTFRFELLSEHL